MANGYLHNAFESTPGNETNTPTLSTKVLFIPLISFDPDLGVNHLERDDELRNVDEPISVVPDDYAPKWSVESRMYPDTLGFELKGILGSPVTTVGNGVITDPDGIAIPTGATRHVWTAPFGPSGASPQTAQRQSAYKDEGFFLKHKGCATEQLGIETPESGGARIKSQGPNLYTARVADPALSPTFESLSVLPFERGDLTIKTWLASTATTEDFNVNIASPVDPVSSLATASRFPDLMEKGDGPIVFTGSIPKRHINAADWDALVNATGFAAAAKWISRSIIASAYPYGLWVEFLNAQYTSGGPETLANKRRLGGTFDFKSTYAGVAGSTKVTLVNATSSYA